MTIGYADRRTAIGTGKEIDVGSPKTLTFAMVSENGDAVASAEVQLVDGGNWVTAFTPLGEGEPKSTNGPVKKIRINVTNLGSGSFVDFEVLGERQ